MVNMVVDWSSQLYGGWKEGSIQLKYGVEGYSSAREIGLFEGDQKLAISRNPIL